jgi:hypothetical protein
VPQAGSAANRPPDLLIRNLSLRGRGFSDGRIGEVEIGTDGKARIEGSVQFAGARAGDRLRLRADDRLELITPAGEISVTDAQGQLAGRLQLLSGDIVAADQALAAQLAADPGFQGRAQALRANNGAADPDGYIQADAVELYAGRAIYLRNSGTATNFAGVTVGSGGLVIGRFSPVTTLAVADPNGLDLVAFGGRRNPDGSFTSGRDFFGEVDFGFDDGVTYTELSEFNGCPINSGCAAPLPAAGFQPPSADIVTGPIGRVDDRFDEPPADEDVAVDDEAGALNVPQSQLLDSSFVAEPLIKEPVTSGADSLLWECDGAGDDICEGGTDG